ncbi:MAG: AAA family ATPase [Candidatus Aminicenantes bacterium]|nr:AAA family ATPase [Candidatus Aminicenantes bacterium]
MIQLERDLSMVLGKWKNDPGRKPLILKGARQVGKSWLARELGKTFDNFVEINFERKSEACAFFDGNIEPAGIIKNISNYFGVKITPGATLLFLDEIQECPKAIMALRYFYEDLPQLHVISAGSLLEFELQNINVPVGRVNFIYVYPLSFSEYLTVSGKHNLRTMLLENKFKPVPEPIHKLLNEEVRNYVLLGGMPEVIADFLEFGQFDRSRDIQTDLLETYRSDFQKYAKKHQVKYLHKVFESIPLQLGDKFKYTNVSEDIKSRELGDALDMLQMAGIAYKVYHSSANGIPLKAESDIKKFKVLFFDAGLTQQLLQLDYRPFLLNPDFSRVNNGAIAELFTGLELIAYRNYKEKADIFYWHREAKSSNAEVDYITTLAGKIVPVEVKSSTTGGMKSLRTFMQIKNRNFAIKVSGFNFSLFDCVQSVPFYALESLVKGN